MAPRNGLVAGLDIGTSKVCCFIARADEEGRPHVTGIGHQLSRGVRNGSIIDMEAAETAILTAVHAAEQMSGETIHEVIVNISGGYPASQTIGVEVTIAGHEVNDGDLRRVLDQGKLYEGSVDRRLIHSIPVGYIIDGSRGIRDPRGMYGERLGVDMHVITAAAGAVRNITTCVARCHLDIRALVISPYAAGLASLVEDEMDLGVTVIDMGGGTTNLAVFFDGNVVYTDSVPIGGGHVTNDIARGLSTPLSHAERMKTLYGNCIPSPADERDVINVPQVGEDDVGQANAIPKSILVGIIQPRLEETFELVRSRLEAGGFERIAGRRVVLTGGASQLAGVRELAALVLDKQVRMGRPIRIGGLAEATGGPAFATCAGLLTYALETEVDAPRPTRPLEEGSNGLIGRIGHWFREYF
ncbi:cell division protein FtsA [Virgifigura deserti]|uniref:cell division protein FtsA n=1 Tax=Virgifigura deserti TaxID=2268457 RepID=UPI003CCB9BBD